MIACIWFKTVSKVKKKSSMVVYSINVPTMSAILVYKMAYYNQT